MSGTQTNPLMRTPGPLELIGPALQARLQSVFTAKRFNFDYVPARMTLKEWNRLGGLAPFVGIGWKGVPVREQYDSTFHAAAQWTVYLIAKNAGSVQARYQGDALGAGVLRLVQSGISLLNGWTIADVGACQVLSAGNLWVDGWEAEGCSLASIELTVTLDIDAPDTLDFGDVPVLTELVTTWTQPSGEILLVDTDTAIATEDFSA